MFYILTGRFNNETWQYNNNYRISKNIPCIYACPHKITQSIPYDSNLFVIEMNNSTNQIIGIGLIKNKIKNLDKTFKIQNDFNYNRYIYIGSHYICREKLYNYNENLVIILEKILFKGKTHSKRGAGLTQFPFHLFKRVSTPCDDFKRVSAPCDDFKRVSPPCDDLKTELKNIFVRHYTNYKFDNFET